MQCGVTGLCARAIPLPGVAHLGHHSSDLFHTEVQQIALFSSLDLFEIVVFQQENKLP